MKLNLTFTRLLEEARLLKRKELAKAERRRCLWYFIRGAKHYDIPNYTEGGK